MNYTGVFVKHLKSESFFNTIYTRRETKNDQEADKEGNSE